jgi:XTP/dITP diphosphohydrolase
MPLPKLLIASNNLHKIAEFRRLFVDLPCGLVTPHDLGLNLDVDETGDTFEANARLKAHAFAEASGLPALADDSGIEVDALNGRPGVHSARYGGEGLDDNGRVQLLLREMAAVPDDQRACRYRVVLMLVGPYEPDGSEGSEDSTEGRCEGLVARETSGVNGFGYDPVFYIPAYGKTIAEIGPDQKDEISHRGKAARAMAEVLASRTA